MFTQAIPILDSDDHHSVGAEAILARFDALGLVTAALARLCGEAGLAVRADLAGQADLASAIAAMPGAMVRRVATECDSIALALTAGLVALEKARRAGRMNPAAAQMLYDEASAAIHAVRLEALQCRWT